MKIDDTALVLIGYQNDYFASDGILRKVIEESSRVTNVLENTISLVENLAKSSILIISTPILFTQDYSEIVEPIGILKTIKDTGSFKKGSKGSETIKELSPYKSRILEVPGKRGLNPFHNTRLNEILKEKNIKNLVLAGVVTSLCIDSAARAAIDYGYKVVILSDCTSGRTQFEQEFYTKEIFPLYAEVLDHNQFLTRIK